MLLLVGQNAINNVNHLKRRDGKKTQQELLKRREHMGPVFKLIPLVLKVLFSQKRKIRLLNIISLQTSKTFIHLRNTKWRSF